MSLAEVDRHDSGSLALGLAVARSDSDFGDVVVGGAVLLTRV